MTGIKLVNLNMLFDEIGEEYAKSCLSSFSCPCNMDVENFIKHKAIDFAKQGVSQTHLVMLSHKGKPVIAGYFTLANKYITISSKNLSNDLRRRLRRFSIYDVNLKSYCLSAPLIAQLGKNYQNSYDKLIKGDTLLTIACDKVKSIQFDLGGRFAYVECEEKQKLINFYTSNGFYEFDTRRLDRDETDVSGTRLIQMLKYMSK